MTTHPGMRTFISIWLGQMASALGTAMTRFALLIWAYQQTNEATTVALLGFFAFGPYILLSPIAGIWVDRLDRRIVMMLADLGAGMSSVVMLGLFTSGQLQIWHLYVAEAVAGAFEAFQLNAYSAATSTLIPPTQYMRANGLRALGDNLTTIGAPVIAGLLLPIVGIGGIMALDIVSFIVAISALLVVRFPRPAPSVDEEDTPQSYWSQITFGIRYIWHRKGLLGLMLIFTTLNFTASLTYLSVMPAMILARSGGDELTLALVRAALGFGGVLGALWVSSRGGLRPLIHNVLACAALSFCFGDFLMGVGRSLPVWFVGAIATSFFIPFIVSGDRAIWQQSVPLHLQGRVFSALFAFRQILIPVGYLLSGLLADQLFEPMLAHDGALAPLLGPLVGTGPGAGMGFMFVCTAIIGVTVSLAGYLVPSIRNVEQESEVSEIDAVPLAEIEAA